MLRSFRLSNHRSFLEKQELLLIPSAPGRDHETLTVAAIYGANASGKSNLLDGLRFMALSVRESFQRWNADGGVPRKPFRPDLKGRHEPSTFVVEIVVDGVPYTYGFSVDDGGVMEEWLYSYPEKRKRVLFEREGTNIKFGTTVGQLRSMLEIMEELLRPNALFLSLAAQMSLSLLKPVFRWFTHDLGFCGGSADVVHNDDVVRHLAHYLDEDRRRSRLVGLLAAADTGITDLYIKDDHGHIRPGRPKLRFVHGENAEGSFGIEDESDGTRNWLIMLPSVLDALERGGTLVVDEIDASLHPLLTVRLLDLFTGMETNPNGAQLIFTTHDTTPLGNYAGREVLQRDQVWFVEKDAEGKSKLYPLSDFKPRIGENAEKRYLGGSYGAVPMLTEYDFGESVRE